MLYLWPSDSNGKRLFAINAAGRPWNVANSASVSYMLVMVACEASWSGKRYFCVSL